ncbi:MAG: DNA polymerase beta subunit [uncultured bacterium]|nr:MAG: DNA polymerase beta subunit [uncultured bacterium]
MIHIKPEHKNIIRDILINHIPNYEIWAFGSRVTGNMKEYSDLDLAIISKDSIPSKTLALIRYELSESNLPFKVDILEWNSLSENFRAIIEENHEIF